VKRRFIAKKITTKTSHGEKDYGKERDCPAESGDDTSREMSKLLADRRWEPKEGPFQGFQSPPGRF
jgi:hypothetical protein